MRMKIISTFALSMLLGLSALADVSLPALYTFPTSVTNGAAPSGQLLLGSDGYLYGTTQTGGTISDPWGITCGTVFKVNPTNGTFTSLVSFGYTNGARPAGALVQSGSTLYGTTRSGGAYGNGTIFACTTGGTLVTLYSFNYAPALGYVYGAWPSSGVIISGGFLYGVTPAGGVGNSGSVYSSSTSGNFTSLYSFNPTGVSLNEDRADPAAKLLAVASGSLFGVAPFGGSNNQGFVYTLNTSGAYTNAASFNNTNTGMYPRGQLCQATDGSLYGVAEAGGSNTFGGLFKITTNTLALTALAAFDNTNGAYPSTGLLQGPDSYLYGASKTFSTNGAIYQASTNAGALTNMAKFATTNGANPDGMLVYDTNIPAFFGVAAAGGNGNGVIYELNPLPVLVSTNVAHTSATGTQITNTAVVQGVPPLAFAWWHNATNLIANGAQISGAATVSLVLSNVAASNLGTYQLVVTNYYGSISNSVSLVQ